MAAIPADTAAPPRAPAAAADVAAVAAEMVACGSLEMGADSPEDARRIAELLPAGTPVYVNHLPRYPLEHTLKALIALREANLEPVPHVAARRVVSRAEAQAFLAKAVRLAGVTKVLLIGGDVPEPARPLCGRRRALARGFLCRQRPDAGRPARLPRRPPAHCHRQTQRRPG